MDGGTDEMAERSQRAINVEDVDGTPSVEDGDGNGWWLQTGGGHEEAGSWKLETGNCKAKTN